MSFSLFVQLRLRRSQTAPIMSSMTLCWDFLCLIFGTVIFNSSTYLNTGPPSITQASLTLKSTWPGTGGHPRPSKTSEGRTPNQVFFLFLSLYSTTSNMLNTYRTWLLHRVLTIDRRAHSLSCSVYRIAVVKDLRQALTLNFCPHSPIIVVTIHTTEL